MTGAFERRKLNRRGAADLDVVEGEGTNDRDAAVARSEIGTPEVRRRGVQPDAELGAAARVGELDMHIAAIDALFERGYRLLRPSRDLDRMFTLG